MTAKTSQHRPEAKEPVGERAMTRAEAEALVREFEEAVQQYRHTGARLAREKLIEALVAKEGE